MNQIAAYFEDRLSLTDRISIVAGARRDHYHVNRHDELVLTTTESNHDATGWNAGVVYNPLTDLALYGQYAVASDPGNSLSSINANQQGFKLSPGRQVEGGVKQTLSGGRVEWTFAAYDLEKKDLLTPSIVNPTLTEQVGQQRLPLAFRRHGFQPASPPGRLRLLPVSLCIPVVQLCRCCSIASRD